MPDNADPRCAAFLQWALPQLHMRWAGFRKVRNQVCRRLQRRVSSLQLSGPLDYRDYLQQHPEEWRVLDTLCRITISRFCRDQGIFRLLAVDVIPALAEQARREGCRRLDVWSAGCASGEEPYTLAILWALQLQRHLPDIALRILATDVDAQLLRRARTACYPYSSLKDLPTALRDEAFGSNDGSYCLRARFKCPVLLVQHDIREPLPVKRLQLILCRNLVYTYYDTDLQCAITQRLAAALAAGGILVIGSHEALPAEAAGFVPLPAGRGIYRRAGYAGR